MADWNAIRAEYEDGASLRSLAAKHGVSKSVIGDRKHREKWTEHTDNRTDASKQGIVTRDLNPAVRVTLAIKLRAKKLTYQEIADQAGYSSPSAARTAIMRELDRVIVAEVEQYRHEELAMLNRLHSSLWDQSIDEKNQYQTFAADRILAISDRRAKLLGLDMKPDEEIANQNYTKRIVLVDETPEVKQ